jgi:hypothetical protein
MASAVYAMQSVAIDGLMDGHSCRPRSKKTQKSRNSLSQDVDLV